MSIVSADPQVAIAVVACGLALLLVCVLTAIVACRDYANDLDANRERRQERLLSLHLYALTLKEQVTRG